MSLKNVRRRAEAVSVLLWSEEMLFYTTIYKEIGRSSASRSQKTKKANMLDFDLMLNKLWSSSHLSNVRFSKENSFDLQFRWEKTKGFLAEFSSAKSKETRQMLLKERLKGMEAKAAAAQAQGGGGDKVVPMSKKQG